MQIGAIVFDSAAIVDAPVVVVDVFDAVYPVPCVRGVFGVCLVIGIAGKSSTHVEEDAVGDG